VTLACIAAVVACIVAAAWHSLAFLVDYKKALEFR